MTGRQSYILGCDFAIHQLTKKGSEIYVVHEGNQYIQVAWKDILEWLEKEYNKQEPFINKPCVSSEVCEYDKQKAFDKIKAEILENAFSVVNPNNTYEYINVLDLGSIEKIIDKYKAETEET